MIAWYWSWMLTIVSCIGFYFAARRPLLGWSISLFTEVLWVAYAVLSKQWGFIFGAFFFSVIFILNIRKARRTT